MRARAIFFIALYELVGRLIDGELLRPCCYWTHSRGNSVPVVKLMANRLINVMTARNELELLGILIPF